MVVKKKATKKTTKKNVAPKTKIVYKTRTVYRKAPREEVTPLGGVVRDTGSMIGLGMSAIIGLGVAKSIGNALNNP